MAHPCYDVRSSQHVGSRLFGSLVRRTAYAVYSCIYICYIRNYTFDFSHFTISNHRHATVMVNSRGEIDRHDMNLPHDSYFTCLFYILKNSAPQAHMGVHIGRVQLYTCRRIQLLYTYTRRLHYMRIYNSLTSDKAQAGAFFLLTIACAIHPS